MTDRELKKWEVWRLRGQPVFRLYQAYRCFAACCFGGVILSSLISHHVEFLALSGISAVMTVIWYFFAIGLWHKNEYAYLQQVARSKSLSPVLHRS